MNFWAPADLRVAIAVARFCARLVTYALGSAGYMLEKTATTHRPLSYQLKRTNTARRLPPQAQMKAERAGVTSTRDSPVTLDRAAVKSAYSRRIACRMLRVRHSGEGVWRLDAVLPSSADCSLSARTDA